MPSRIQVYVMIDGERAYQDKRWADDRTPRGVHEHTPAEWLVYIQDYLTKAFRHATGLEGHATDTKVMESLRKIGAMCVAAIEQNGCEPRQ